MLLFNFIFIFQLSFSPLVSILVLMDVTLQHHLYIVFWLEMDVSILVLMDVTLQRKIRDTKIELRRCFNPCFNGCYSSTIHRKERIKCGNPCFNPCFNGCYSSTQIVLVLIIRIYNVSILVLMDVTLQQESEHKGYSWKESFNPCFNGCYSSTMRYENVLEGEREFQSLF